MVKMDILGLLEDSINMSQCGGMWNVTFDRWYS